MAMGGAGCKALRRVDDVDLHHFPDRLPRPALRRAVGSAVVMLECSPQKGLQLYDEWPDVLDDARAGPEVLEPGRAGAPIRSEFMIRRTELPIRRSQNERLRMRNRFHDEERFNCERGSERRVAALLAAIGTGITKLPKRKGRTAIAVACLSRQLREESAAAATREFACLGHPSKRGFSAPAD